MIFNKFNTQDIVAGRVTQVVSGFWPSAVSSISQSNFVDDFWSLTGSVGTPSYGTSVYDVRRTMYYLNMYPDVTYLQNNDPYFSIAYGNIAGNLGSGSFAIESSSIQASPTKAIYTQYSNLLITAADELNAQFSMQSGSTTVLADDIWVINFSSYKTKDQVNEGLIQLTFSGSNGSFTFIDDSYYLSQTQTVYQIIQGTLASPPAVPTYQGIGLLYPSEGIIVFNAAILANILGITNTIGVGKGTGGPLGDGSWPYNPNLDPTTQFTYNHKTLATSMEIATASMNVQKTEYVPSRHYFVRVMNQNFNYSNNPTYVYDGTDGIHAAGTIRVADFINNPQTYVTTIGLYNDNNELVAAAKLSRPAVKSFDSELLLKVRLDW